MGGKVDTWDADARKAAGAKVKARAAARAPKLSEGQKDATIEAQAVTIETWRDEAKRLAAVERENAETIREQRAALDAWRVEARRMLDALALAAPGNGDSSWYAIGRAQAVILHALGVEPDDQDRELLDAIERTAEERARLFETR